MQVLVKTQHEIDPPHELAALGAKEIKMRNPLSSACALLLMLVLGVGLGRFMAVRTSTKPVAAKTAEFPALPPPGNFDGSRRDANKPDSPRQAAAHYVAVTFARQAADVVGRSEGRIDTVYVDVGDPLKSGDVIARIESASVTQELEIAKASLRSVKAEENNAIVELNEAEARTTRRKQLAELGLLSKEDLETAQVQLEKAQANLSVSQARVDEQVARIARVQQSITDTVVRAPFTGQVAARYLDPGATVHSGVPIVRIIRADDLWVRFAIPEQNQAAILPGATVRFCPQGTSDVIPAIIEHISPEVAAMAQEIVVEARLRMPSGLNWRIRPGDVGLVSPVCVTHEAGHDPI